MISFVLLRLQIPLRKVFSICFMLLTLLSLVCVFIVLQSLLVLSGFDVGMSHLLSSCQPFACPWLDFEFVSKLNQTVTIEWPGSQQPGHFSSVLGRVQWKLKCWSRSQIVPTAELKPEGHYPGGPSAFILQLNGSGPSLYSSVSILGSFIQTWMDGALRIYSL